MTCKYKCCIKTGGRYEGDWGHLSGMKTYELGGETSYVKGGRIDPYAETRFPSYSETIPTAPPFIWPR
jgi:hypothetical protein